MTAPRPGDGVPSDPDGLVAQVDALLATDAGGAEEAALLEQAHRLIADALEGH